MAEKGMAEVELWVQIERLRCRHENIVRGLEAIYQAVGEDGYREFDAYAYTRCFDIRNQILRLLNILKLLTGTLYVMRVSQHAYLDFASSIDIETVK